MSIRRTFSLAQYLQFVLGLGKRSSYGQSPILLR